MGGRKWWLSRYASAQVQGEPAALLNECVKAGDAISLRKRIIPPIPVVPEFLDQIPRLTVEIRGQRGTLRFCGTIPLSFAVGSPKPMDTHSNALLRQAMDLRLGGFAALASNASPTRLRLFIEWRSRYDLLRLTLDL
ncbi:hypothetical protein [Paenibacillus vulneris]|uniref:Uncharacterized protein n=1 Tax=Paenibacillus vulneris TaxID=1133364 RepID=A0ABW3UUL4_9BACL